jgi:peptidoglycan-associated lipoprotein
MRGLSSCVLALGCSHSQPPPLSPAHTATLATPAPPTEKERTDLASKSQISISDDIRQACGIADPDAYFAFDSTRLSDQDDRVLGKLADCFESGPLKGKTMRLVGHTDPRGDDDYNLVLGQRRADEVKAFLGKKRLSTGRMQSMSRGEMDATGHDEQGFSKDRRVDILAAS